MEVPFLGSSTGYGEGAGQMLSPLSKRGLEIVQQQGRVKWKSTWKGEMETGMLSRFQRTM